MHEPREDHLRAGPLHQPVSLELHDQPLQVRVVPSAHTGDRVGVAGHAPGFDHLRVGAERLGHLVEQRPRGEEQLDQGLGQLAQRGVVDDGGEPPEYALSAQPVNAALDRRRGERDVAADVVVGAPAVCDEQRKNLSI